MTDIDIDARWQFAQRITREGAELGADMFRNRDALSVTSKGVQNLVSNADKEIEAMVRRRLAEEFPEDAFFGEESGRSARAGADQPLWVVDPIDGTDNFVHGFPGWCVSVAMVVGREVEIGILHDPLADEVFAARRGHGATLNGKPLAPEPASSFRDGIVGMGYSLRRPPENTLSVLEKLLAEQGMYQRLGSGALMIGYVAAGRFIGFYEAHLNPWDCMAGIALVRETGCWVNDFLAGDGLYEGNPLAAAAPGLADAMRRITGLE